MLRKQDLGQRNRRLREMEGEKLIEQGPKE